MVTFSNHEIWTSFAKCAIESPPIFSDHYGDFERPRAYCGLTSEQVDKCFEELPVSPDWRLGRLKDLYDANLIDFIAGDIKHGSLWFAIGLFRSDLEEAFPEMMDRLDAFDRFNKAVSKGQYVHPYDYFEDYDMKRELAYVDSLKPMNYTKVKDVIL